MKPQIILLNGTSSSGKTSLTKALQQILPEPYFHVCIDSFEEMMPPRLGHSDSARGAQVLGAALSAMNCAISSLASAGENIIVDHVLIEGEKPLSWVPMLLSAIKPYVVLYVKVYAPVEVLQRRESARGDRPRGLAEWQSTRMHTAFSYDLEIETSALAPTEAARIILNYIQQSSAD